MSQSNDILEDSGELAASMGVADENGDMRPVNNGDDFDSESDIIFDCPHCAHQLVIEMRGAGLTVDCTECGNAVVVPIPEGMEVSDLDESSEELFGQVLQLRRSLKRAEERIAEMDAVVAALVTQRDALEDAHQQLHGRLAGMRDHLQLLVRCHSDMAGAVEQLQAIIEEEQS